MSTPINDDEFGLFQRLIYRLAGISLPPGKKILVVGRLSKGLDHFGFSSFTDYYRLLASGSQAEEVQQFIDLLTTNETCFFREPEHFEFLREHILPACRPANVFRIWSGACSSGEEPYTMAMVLGDCFPHRAWEVFASDISLKVPAQARKGEYPLERAQAVPAAFLRKYCLKGVRSQEGRLLLALELRQQVRFAHINLTARISGVGLFDVIFLRNVMIYFDIAAKRKAVANLLASLKPGGYFIIGHSESLHGITDELSALRPTIYRKPAAAGEVGVPTPWARGLPDTSKPPTAARLNCGSRR